MNEAQPQTVTAAPRSRGRLLFCLGILLFIAGPALYAWQMSVPNLAVPWYLPIMSTLGLLFMLRAMWLRPGILRGIGLLFFLALCGLEWYGMLVMMKTPDYTGPAQVGNKVPTFVAALADGTTFNDQDLHNGKPTVMLFFRGHW
jgi:hypothetical protein